jgi:predicted permease
VTVREPPWRRYLRFWKDDLRADLDDELRFHLESRVQEYVAAGMDPQAARDEAMRRFGDLERVRERCRAIDELREQEMRRADMRDALRQDLRYAARSLRRSPGFALVAALTLALGIGATTAIFSAVNGVLLRPLPYKNPERLVRVWLARPADNETRLEVSPVDVDDWEPRQKVFQAMAGYWFIPDASGVDMTGVGTPERLSAAWVMPGFFPALGVGSALGRLPRRAEMVRGGNDLVVVLSDGFWRRRFGSDPAVVGRALTLGGKPHVVLGVMPPSFSYPQEGVDVWIPESTIPDDASPRMRFNRWMQAVARMKPGVTLEQARADMAAVTRQLAEEYPETNKYTAATVEPLHHAIVGEVRPALLVLLAAVAFVLLIACANVANLLLAKASTREREFAIRTALGASRWRVVRQLLTESLLLALAGGAAGVALAAWGARALVALSAGQLPRADEVGLDGRVLAFALGVTVLTGLLFGLVPALRMSSPHLQPMLKEGGRGTVGAGGKRVRSALVVAEVALAVVLVVGAGLMTKSLGRLLSVDPGFRPERVVSVNLTIPPERYETDDKMIAYYRAVIDAVRAVPGVQSAGAVKDLPLRGTGEYIAFDIPGRPSTDADRPRAARLHVSADYFKTMGIPLKAGRMFTEQDRRGAPYVLMVNEAFQRRFWPGESAVGKALQWGTQVPIIGVVGDVRQLSLAEPAEPVMYVHTLQNMRVRMNVVARVTGGGPQGSTARIGNAIRQAIWALDRDQTITSVTTLDDVVSEAVARPRLLAVLLGLFGATGLALGAIGLYGVLAYHVSQRRQELGVRMALGAQPRDVLRLVVGEGMALTAIGIATGLAAALVLTRYMRAVLFGVAGTDPATFAGVAAVLAVVALLACLVPARRATRVDPVRALRSE